MGDQVTAADECFEFEGARVHGDSNMSEESKDALREVIAAAKRRFADEPPRRGNNAHDDPRDHSRSEP